MGMSTAAKSGETGGTVTASIGARVKAMGLDPSLLYEAVIELADEGMLTARCINAGADILVGRLGLPAYYFRNITKEGLKSILRVLSAGLEPTPGGGYRLSAHAGYLSSPVDGGAHFLIAPKERLAAMEPVAWDLMRHKCWEYYCSPEREFYTYIIKPRVCPDGEQAVGTFAFRHDPGQAFVPAETGKRYEDFLARQETSVRRLVEFSTVEGTGETRIMFRKNVNSFYLPAIRHLLSDLGLHVTRAYGETYRAAPGKIGVVASFYVDRAIAPDVQKTVSGRLQALFSAPENPFADLFIRGELSFHEMLFAVAAKFFVHQFIFRELESDRQIMASLARPELREALAKRITDANHSEFTRRIVREALRNHPDLVRELFDLFDARFNPRRAGEWDAEASGERIRRFQHELEVRFINDSTTLEIFRFATRLATDVNKTNFYATDKRSFSFRLEPEVLDPLVFPGPVYSLFFVAGHFSIGIHMRAEDIARGGLRLLRVTPNTYENALDEACLLDYALGPKAQRLKHKDIAENGAKGVIVPTPDHTRDTKNTVFDFTEGVLDLILPSQEIVDYLGKPEMIFFGPDEGTAEIMDAVALRAKERGYEFWRTLTTGKSSGIPHDAFGTLEDGRVFALQAENAGTRLAIDGAHILTTRNPDDILEALSAGIARSGMTTTGVLECFRTLLDACGLRESQVPLMMTGGPDGDLGANQIQSCKGKLCLIIDSGGVLFDPDGLDKTELLRLAVARHRRPRPNSADYPRDKIGPAGFFVSGSAGNAVLPSGVRVEDGAYFHRNFLVLPETRELVAAAGIQAFIPCGGFKDTINFRNVREFLANFPQLRFIVEGANVFFDDPAREIIARESSILQIRDSSANKGGVTASSLAEVLGAFLLGDRYEEIMVENAKTRFALAAEMLDIIARNARMETEMLLALHEAAPETPLYRLSVQTSEQLLAFQAELRQHLTEILDDAALVDRVYQAYIPATLLEATGIETVRSVFARPEMSAYRAALVTKKLAAAATYRYAPDWESFLERFQREPMAALRELV